MSALYLIFAAGVGGAIMGAILWAIGRLLSFLSPPKEQEKKDPVEEQLKESAEWLNRKK